METFAWFEQTAFSIGVREIPFVFPLVLIVHAVGMGLSAGASLAISLRALGFAPRIPFAAMTRFLPLVWLGFVANLISGLVLLAAYPAKALTNPVFFLKLALLAAGIWTTQRLVTRAAQQAEVTLKVPAALALAMWVGVIVAGRLLAYTHHILLASWEV